MPFINNTLLARVILTHFCLFSRRQYLKALYFYQLGNLQVLTTPQGIPYYLFWGVSRRVSLCSLGYPGASSVDQAGLSRDLIPYASQVLGLKARAFNHPSHSQHSVVACSALYRDSWTFPHPLGMSVVVYVQIMFRQSCWDFMHAVCDITRIHTITENSLVLWLLQSCHLPFAMFPEP